MIYSVNVSILTKIGILSDYKYILLWNICHYYSQFKYNSDKNEVWSLFLDYQIALLNNHNMAFVAWYPHIHYSLAKAGC